MARRITSLTLSLVCFVSLTLISYLVVKGYNDRVNWVNHTILVRRALIETANGLQMAQRGQRGYLLTGEEDYLKPYEEGIHIYRDRMELLRREVQDNKAQRYRLDNVEVSAKELLEELKKTIEKVRKGHKDEAFAVVGTDRGEFLIANVITSLRECTLEEDRKLEERQCVLVWIGTGCLICFILVGASVSLSFQMLVREYERRQSDDIKVRNIIRGDSNGGYSGLGVDSRGTGLDHSPDRRDTPEG